MLSFMLLHAGLIMVFGSFSEGIGTVVKVAEARTGREFTLINHTALDELTRAMIIDQLTIIHRLMALMNIHLTKNPRTDI
jgi:hypothetical protein